MLRQMLRTIAVQPSRQMKWRVIPFLMFALSFARKHRQPVFSWPEGGVQLGRRVALFVHFDRRGAVQPYVRQYLAALQDAGCSVLFVTNATFLQPEALEAIKPLCAGILIRRNVGYDFGAMREGLEHFGLPRADTDMLILANDSVYGPLVPLDDLLSRTDFTAADLWGATDSWQRRYHLQSFFLVASGALLRHPAWAAYWAQVRPVANKSWVITHYEVGLTQWMLRAGIRCEAVWPYSSVIREIDTTAWQGETNQAGAVSSDPLVENRWRQAMQVRARYSISVPLNPTSDLWRRLLRSGFPFLKRELLRDNPTHVADVVDWRDEVARISAPHVALIEGDLQRVMRNRAP
jgi:hypothetical protein